MIPTGRDQHEPLKELLISAGPGGLDGPDNLRHKPYSDTANANQ